MDDLLAPLRTRACAAAQPRRRLRQARHPKIAGRLMLSGDVGQDPHVERLIESFALLADRACTSASTTTFRFSPRASSRSCTRTTCGPSIVRDRALRCAGAPAAPTGHRAVTLPRGTTLVSRAGARRRVQVRDGLRDADPAGACCAAAQFRAAAAPRRAELPTWPVQAHR